MLERNRGINVVFQKILSQKSDCFIHQRDTAGLSAFSCQFYLGWCIQTQIPDTQIDQFLDPCTTVIQERKECLVTTSFSCAGIRRGKLVVQYVKLFRMPLFLTVLDDELKKYDDSVWENESIVKETAFKVMPVTLHQFSFPKEEIDKTIDQCVTGFFRRIPEKAL